LQGLTCHARPHAQDLALTAKVFVIKKSKPVQTQDNPLFPAGLP
jgi:hypothetical protein